LSWAAHDFEPYVLQKHLGGKVSILALYLGSVGPDMYTKWLVYGVTLFGVHIQANDPAYFHRAWPGAGFTHAPLFGVLVGLMIFLLTRNRIWAFSFGLGMVAHALTDTLDTNGTMLLFPISTQRFSLGAWAYAAEEGHLADGIAYYSSLGLVGDLVWGTLALASWPVLKRVYFESTVLVSDPVWRFLARFMSTDGLLVVYRLGFAWGVTRVFAWVLWVHVFNSHPFDFDWGGPSWVTPIR
jgi:membrane-bound metal-dependent hydrolase YbcI (DUF457 family)